jgi:hypothetical protein
MYLQESFGSQQHQESLQSKPASKVMKKEQDESTESKVKSKMHPRMSFKWLVPRRETCHTVFESKVFSEAT